MHYVQEWQSLGQALNKAREWESNCTKVDSQSGRKYKKVVHISENTFQYCGQAYAGANNYHSPNKELIGYITSVLTENMNEIVEEALSRMEADYNKSAIQAKGELENILGTITALEEK